MRLLCTGSPPATVLYCYYVTPLRYMDSEFRHFNGDQRAVDVIDVKDGLRDLVRIYRRLPAECHAYDVIKQYLSLESPTPEQRREFLLWIADEENAEAKKNALEAVSHEYYTKQ